MNYWARGWHLAGRNSSSELWDAFQSLSLSLSIGGIEGHHVTTVSEITMGISPSLLNLAMLSSRLPNSRHLILGINCDDKEKDRRGAEFILELMQYSCGERLMSAEEARNTRNNP